MSNCLMCNRKLNQSLTLAVIFSFSAYQAPAVCERCAASFQPIEPAEACPGCSRKQASSDFCQDCLRWQKQVPASFVTHKALYVYDDVMREWLHRYKIQGDVRMATVMSRTLEKVLSQFPDATVVPVPVSKISLERRGFNQCEQLLRMAGFSYTPLLKNITQDKKQSEKNRQERMQSPQPFQVDFEWLPGVSQIILFDDLYTTGRTMMHAKEALASAGLTVIKSVSIGR